MAKLTVTFTSDDPGAARRAHFDGVPLTFDGNTATRTRPPGEFAFTWFIYAAKGSRFEVAVRVHGVDRPLYETDGTIDESLKDGEITWLTIA
jgi:hypothetical protein